MKSGRPTVKARNISSDLEIEVWSGNDETTSPPTKYVVLRVMLRNRGRSWIMMDPSEWTRLKTLVDRELES